MEGEAEEMVDEWDVCPVLVMVRNYVAQLCEDGLCAFIPTTTLKKPTSPIALNSKNIILYSALSFLSSTSSPSCT